MSEAEKPIGAPTDFGFASPEERERRRLAALNLDDAEQEFQREQARIAKQRRERDRKAVVNADTVPKPPKPPNLRHLLVARMPSLTEGGHPIFKVVGFYSDRALLAEHLGGAAMKYAEAGGSLGVVDFDLNVLQDQPAVDP